MKMIVNAGNVLKDLLLCQAGSGEIGVSVRIKTREMWIYNIILNTKKIIKN